MTSLWALGSGLWALGSAWALGSIPLAAQGAPTLTATRDLKIDGTTHDFVPIYRLAIGNDGSIGVWQFKDSKILFFDDKGVMLGSVGRSGQGPGEFRHLGNFGSYRDTLWVNDIGRIAIISPSHAFIRNELLPPSMKMSAIDGSELTIGRPTLIAIRGDGHRVWMVSLPRTGPRPSWAPPGELRQAVLLTTADQRFERLLGWAPGPAEPRCMVPVTSGSMEAVLGIPFCAGQITTFSDDGRWFVVLEQENAPGGTATFRIIKTATSGQAAETMSLAYATIPIPRHVTDSILSLQSSPTGPNRGTTPEILAAFRSMRIPATYAPVRRMIVGRDGSLWLEMETTADDHTWRVIGANGESAGQLVLPRNVTLMATSRGTVWGVEKDQDDVESVVRYRVNR